MKNKEEKKILLSYGSGGRYMHNLIKEIFLPAFSSPTLSELGDSAVLKISGADYELCFTTDSYTIEPLFFPGGDIGKLSVCGTVNDLAVVGANPLYLSCGIIVEEGLEIKTLERIVQSIAETSKKAGIEIVTGDFKVVEKGKADKIFINTSGVGIRKNNIRIGKKFIKSGDKVIINGNIGEHELAVLSARKEFGLSAGIKSDCAPLNGLIKEILRITDKIHFMRDPTRGGLATTLNEIVEGKGYGILIHQEKIPISKKVFSLCEILGFDPLYLANEGKVVVVCGKEDTEKVISAMHRHPLGKRAVVIGEVISNYKGYVVMKTLANSLRIVDMLSGSQLPRIC
ncbi:MAG: hydrogenase expression/formation protein HypE [Candidatus Ratteibacteria bacterium]|nr:hydrogenase expression/formation protein HypE [Candidatus Ratteibacteria bacterium]